MLIAAVIIVMLLAFSITMFKMEDVVYAHGEVGAINDYELRTMVDGNIIGITKDEGDQVEKGEVIIRLDSTELQDKIEMVKNNIRELEAELDLNENAAELLRADPLPKEYRHAETQLDECRKRLNTSKDKFERYKGIFEKSAISKTEFEKVELEYIKDKADLKKAQVNFEKVKKGMGEKIIEKSDNELKLLKVKLENKKKELGILEKHLDDYAIKAPGAGMLTYLTYKTPRYVQKGDILARLATVKQKKYIAYVDERKIYKIRPGQASRINSRSYNYFNFGYFKGEVYQIGELPVKKNDAFFYPVEILVKDEPYNLKFGSTAEIMIVTGRERIIICLLGLNE